MNGIMSKSSVRFLILLSFADLGPLACSITYQLLDNR